MLGAATSEDAATEDEVRSMLDPELTAALEHLDSPSIQAVLEEEGEVPPLQSGKQRQSPSAMHARCVYIQLWMAPGPPRRI